MVWQVTMTTSNRLAQARSILWICVGVIAVWFGNSSTQAWRTTLSPTEGLEQGIVELFGSDFQWAALLAAIPVIFWASGKQIEFGLIIPLGLFASGYGITAFAFLFAIIGLGLFLDLAEDQWQSAALSATSAMLVFAFLSPWAAAIGGGLILATHAARKSVALPALVVFFPSVIAAILLVVFLVNGLPSLVDGVAALGVLCLSAPLLTIGVGFVALLLSFGAVHPTAVLADSVGVYEVDAPVEIAPELLSVGFTLSPDARFALVTSVSEGETEIAEADGWIIVDRAATRP